MKKGEIIDIKKLVILIIAIVNVCLLTFAFAETIVLKSGKTIEGKIIERAENYIKVDIYGVPITYYFHEIEKIDGEERTELFFSPPANIHLGKGTKHYDNGEYEQAIEEFKKAIEIKPDFYQAYHNLGLSYASLAQYQDAKNSFEKTIQIKPDSAETYKSLGKVCIALKNYDDSLFYYKKYTELNPNDAQAYFDIGMIYNILGNAEQMIHYFEEAVKVNPNFAEAYSGLGSTYLFLKQYNKARENLQKAKGLFEKQGNHKAALEVEGSLKRNFP